VLAQCTALAYLDLGYNAIDEKGIVSLRGVLAQCASLADIELGGNQKEYEE
jgi:hypothetical protein